MDPSVSVQSSHASPPPINTMSMFDSRYQTAQPIPSLPELISLLASSSSSPSTLAPPSSSTYPSTSAHPTNGADAKPKQPNLVPVYIELPADLLTPVAAYLKIAEGSKHSFLLESVIGGESLARYSFVGAGECGMVGMTGWPRRG
jgi:anthranilate synthase component 1